MPSVQACPYLDDFIARKFEIGNVDGVASHQVTVQDAKDGLVSNDQEIIFLAFQLKNDRLESYCKIVIGLFQSAIFVKSPMLSILTSARG